MLVLLSSLLNIKVMNKDYSQPDFYRFNSDSIALIDWICGKKTSCRKVLDLGAGCGIIGIELAQKIEMNKLTLVELQTDYEEHLKRNIQLYLPQRIEVEILWTAFGDLNLTGPYDLIVCNPPYYLPGHGQKSKDERRMIARAFIRDSWWHLIQIVDRYLSEEGEAIFVLKNERIIIENILKELKVFKLSFKFHETRDLVFLEILRLNKNRN